MHSALSCFLRRRFPLFRYHTYGAIPVCQKDPSTPLGMTLRGIALSKHIRCTLREINPSPLPSFRAQREIFLARCSFWLLSQKFSHFPLSHIGRYTGVQERSLHFARDDVTEVAFSQHIRCTLREINSSPLTSFRAQREIFLALCSFWLLSQKFSHFPLSHIGRYTSVQERSLHFARDDDTGSIFQTYPLYAA